jgi:hypothetical protein
MVAIFLVAVLAISKGKGMRFLRGVLRGPEGGADVFVVVSVAGKDLVYKNPNRPYNDEDKPLETIPPEIFRPDQYETYYNICWFDCGTLFRCGHSYHRTPENAANCAHSETVGSFIGKVMEER